MAAPLRTRLADVSRVVAWVVAYLLIGWALAHACRGRR
jgi:hypothetical protein